MHRATEEQVRLDIPFQGVKLRTASTDAAIRRPRAHIIQKCEPMSRRRFAGWAIGPEFRQCTRKVTARHHIGLIRQSGCRVHRTADPKRTATGSVVVVLPIGWNGRLRRITHRSWGNIPHHAVGWIQVRRPAQHNLHARAERGVVRTRAHVLRRRAGIKPYGPAHSIARAVGAIGSEHPEGSNSAPLRRLKCRKSARNHIALLINKTRQRQRLPLIRKLHVGIAAN